MAELLFMAWHRPLLMLALAALAGCAAMPQPLPEESRECRALFQQVDDAVEQQGVRDYGPARVEGYPYLRVDRLLASFRDEVKEEERFVAWSRHLAMLDAQARRLEVSNLAAPVAGMNDALLLGKLDECREHLIASELALPEMRDRLRKAAQVPDAYLGWRRAAGLYPITAPLVSTAIAQWHSETAALFKTPLQQLPVAGTLTRWAAPRGKPLERAQVETLLAHADALGLPILSTDEQQRLFDTFAPIWEVDVVSDDDRIGAPYWSRKNALAVNIGQPMVYKRLSHTRFAGRVLLQLNYIIWFPARPGDDSYSGQLDGINWRVTLGPDGTPWLFDAMHNCGCYYQVFPTARLRMRDDLASLYREVPLQPQAAPEGEPLIVRLAHATHYIQRIYHGERTPGASLLSWSDYDTLRALPAPGGSRSLFGEYGIVAASRRSERFYLWPMGIRSPGAMRQWGQHAIAFIGRRHFDDAHLLDALFEYAPAP